MSTPAAWQRGGGFGLSAGCLGGRRKKEEGEGRRRKRRKEGAEEEEQQQEQVGAVVSFGSC